MVLVNKVHYDKADLGRRLLAEIPPFSQDKKLREEMIGFMMELTTYSADLNGTISGFASIRQTAANVFEIVMMAVLPSLQHKGVGRALLNKIESDLGEADARFLIVKVPMEEGVSTYYSSASHFFKKNEFTPLDIIKGSTIHDGPSLFMVKTIAEASNVGEYTWY